MVFSQLFGTKRFGKAFHCLFASPISLIFLINVKRDVAIQRLHGLSNLEANVGSPLATAQRPDLGLTSCIVRWMRR